MHRYALLALIPAVLGCANPDTDACASFMVNNAATASAFCATFTQSKVTATSDLPAWATACKSKPKNISKECACHFTAGAGSEPTAPAAQPTSVQVTTAKATSAPATKPAAAETSAPASAPPADDNGSSGGSPGGSNTCGSAAVDELVGFGAGTTGGGNGEGVTVTSCSELEAAIANGGVIKIKGMLTGCDVLKVNGDTTIIGVGADSGMTDGGLRVRKANNVILRNLKMRNPPKKKDCIDIDAAVNVWVDHCDLGSEGLTGDKDYYDGLLDVKHGSDKVTLSWNKLHDHWKASLVGHSDNNAGEDQGKLHVTYHHNYWSNINSRAPSFRFGTGHVYSSCYEDIPTSGVHPRMGAEVLIEANSFTNVRRAIVTNIDSKEDGSANDKDNLFEDSDKIISQTSSFTPDYEYDVDPASCVCELVKAKAGTGVVG